MSGIFKCVSEEYPDHEEIIKEVLDTWIQVLDFKGDPVVFRKYGLDLGEFSLFLAAINDT